MFSEVSELKSNNILKQNDLSLDVISQDTNSNKIENDISGENINLLNFKKIGKLIILYENEQGIKYVMGPLFPFFFIINLLVNIFILKVVYNNIPIIFRMIGTIINFIQIFLFISSSTKNPGLPLKEYSTLIYEEENKNAKNFRQCKDCKLWINTDEKTIHCKKCGICIEGYDHHCDCINICVGKRNLKNFYLLILVSFLVIIYGILITLGFK